MSWLLRALRTLPVLLGIVVAGGVSGVMHGEYAPIPSLAQGQTAPVPVVAVLALAPAVAVLWGWAGLPAAQAAGAARPVTVVLLVGVLTAPVLAGASAWAVSGAGAGLEATRNTLGLLGLALIGTRLLGDRGALLIPLGYLMLAFLFGRPAGTNTPSRWAWVLVDGGSGLALACASLSYAVGLCVIPRLPEATLRRGDR